jgi:dipeptidyl aminopeptidase/acylaminoacyl peptidase
MQSVKANVQRKTSERSFASALIVFLIGLFCVSAAPPPVPFAKPYLVVEAWLDRANVSDLYVYDLDGKQLQRLTQPPLPTCAHALVTPEGSEVAFVANASALYMLSLRHNSLWCVYAGNPTAMTFSKDGKSIAYAAKKFASSNETVLRAQALFAGGLKPVEIVLMNQVTGLDFAPDALHLIATVSSNYSSSVVSYKLDSKQMEILLSDEDYSYSSPCFTPDGGAVVAIKQTRRGTESSIVSTQWPKQADTVVVRTFPKGRSVDSLAVSFDGNSILFVLDGVLGRMRRDGTALEGLSGELPMSEVNAFRNKRRGTSPISMSTNHVVLTSWEGNNSEISLLDLRTKQKRILSLPRVNIRSVHLVE